MGNIVNDIVDQIDIKPNKNKLILKWVITIACSLVIAAYGFGQFKASFFNRLDIVENKIDENSVAIKNLETLTLKGLDDVNGRIDKGYQDGILVLEEYQKHNKKQLGLLIDYGSENKGLLKEMLSINTLSLHSQLQRIGGENNLDMTPKSKITVTPVTDKGYVSMGIFVQLHTQDTVFQVRGATREFVNGLNKDKYEVGIVMESEKYSNKFDFSYKNK